MTQEQRMDRLDRQITGLKDSTAALLKLAAENDRRWAQEQQKWKELLTAILAALDPKGAF